MCVCSISNRSSLQAFSHRLEVSNYAMKERSHSHVQELERINTLRKIEMAEEKVHGLQIAFTTWKL